MREKNDRELEEILKKVIDRCKERQIIIKDKGKT
jgi:hypothetical protein